jgi:predicted nucleic acid-binding protein
MPSLLVVDCSVAIKWVLDEAGAAEAIELLESHGRGEVTLVAPDLLRLEAASLLARRTRNKRSSPLEATRSYEFVAAAMPHLFPSQQLLPQALQIAFANQLSLWDAIYISLAIRLDCPLITADNRLIRSATGFFPNIQLLENR